MTGYLKERFGDLRYDDRYDIANYGRYRAWFSNMSKMEGEGMSEYMTGTVLPTIGKTLLDISTFGLMKHNVNKDRLMVEWNKFRDETGSNITLDAYLEVVQGQTRALINELRVMLVLALSLFALGFTDDDDEDALYKKYAATRVIHKLLTRTENEIRFAYSINEFTRLLANPFSFTKYAQDLIKIGSYAGRDIKNVVTGEELKKNQKKLYKHVFEFAPGYQGISGLWDTLSDSED